jgi:hypothetical protein
VGPAVFDTTPPFAHSSIACAAGQDGDGANPDRQLVGIGVARRRGDPVRNQRLLVAGVDRDGAITLVSAALRIRYHPI